MAKKIHIKTSGASGAWGMLMTHKMRSAWVMSAPTMTGSAIAGAILSAMIISGGPATASEPWPPWPNTPAEMQKLIYSPWVKVCSKGQYPGATEVCFTRKDARTADGETIVTVALIESEGEPKKLLRVTLPNRIQLLHYTTRLVIDNVPATSGKFFTCFGEGGCRTDHEATPELVGEL